MDNLIFLVILVVALPLVGAFWNRSAVFILATLSLFSLLTVALISSDDQARFLFLAQIPTVVLLGYISLFFADRRHREDVDDDLLAKRSEYNALRKKHAQLRKDLVASEKEENASLQIYSVAKGLAEALSWADMAPKLTSGIQKIFGAYEFLLFSIDENSNWNQLHRRGSWTKSPPISGELTGAPSFYLPPQTAEVLPVLYVPIYSSEGEQRVIKGALFLKTAADADKEKMITLGSEFGNQLEMALNKALLFTQMETHSRVDGLTGVLRRGAFMERIQEEFKKAGAFHTNFCVLMVDIDHFKQVNDKYGHAAGDAVLIRVGQILKTAFYETDVVGRYGGEEFIILLPRAQRDGVLRKAEGLRRQIEKEVIQSGFEQIKVTISVGLSEYPSNATQMDDLIAKADQALYQAKETGRNKVIAA